MIKRIGSREYIITEEIPTLRKLLGWEVVLRDGTVGTIKRFEGREGEPDAIWYAIFVEVDDMTTLHFLEDDYDETLRNRYFEEYDVVQIVSPNKKETEEV